MSNNFNRNLIDCNGCDAPISESTNGAVSQTTTNTGKPPDSSTEKTLRCCLTEKQERFAVVADELLDASRNVFGCKKGFNRFVTDLSKMRYTVRIAERVEGVFEQLINEFRRVKYVKWSDENALHKGRIIRRVYFPALPIMLILRLIDLKGLHSEADEKFDVVDGAEAASASEYLVNVMIATGKLDVDDCICAISEYDFHPDGDWDWDGDWNEAENSAYFLSESGVVKLIRKSTHHKWVRSRLESWFRHYAGGLQTELFHIDCV